VSPLGLVDTDFLTRATHLLGGDVPTLATLVDEPLDFRAVKKLGIPGRAGRHDLPLVVLVVRVTGTPGKCAREHSDMPSARCTHGTW
jgi:hypothetical protein